MQTPLVIAIDGPASSGKSTISKILARKYNLVYIDTGAMYRAITWKALKEEADLTNEAEIVDILSQTKIELKTTSEGQCVFVDGQDVTSEIRNNQVTHNVSAVSAFPEIRKELTDRQKELSSSESVIMDGRDIGTVVLPNANLKIFLVASVEERAKRRYLENLEHGFETSLEQLKVEIEERDIKDSSRATAPLKQAEDAIRIDTSGLSIEEVVGEVDQLIKKQI